MLFFKPDIESIKQNNDKIELKCNVFKILLYSQKEAMTVIGRFVIYETKFRI